MNERKQWVMDTILDQYQTYQEAYQDAEYCSQAEALLHMLQGKNVFLSGGAGSGKSYTLERFVNCMKKLHPGIHIAITATTGIAALGIGGTTIHRVSGLGIWKGSYEDYLSTYGDTSPWFRRQQRELKQIDVLITDEVSMLSAQGLGFVVDRLKDARGSLPQIIVVGDYTQLPAVARPEDIEAYGPMVAQTSYKCPAWDELNPTICYLDKSWRAEGDDTLKFILDNIAIGKGRTPENIEALSSIAVTKDVEASNASILMTTNRDVDAHNARQQSFNQGRQVTYSAIYDSPQAENYAKALGIPDELVLKDGDRVMITQNIDPVSPTPEVRIIDMETEDVVTFPVCNGMIGTFVAGNRPKVMYEKDGRHYLIQFLDRHAYSQTEVRPVSTGQGTVPMDVPILTVLQYPIKLAYAISVHKSQGQTLDHILVDLTQCWMPNLGYVALSRVRSVDDITLIKRGAKVGSPNALLVTEESLKIKQEILEESLRNRIPDPKRAIENILDYELPSRTRYSRKNKAKRFV